MNCIDKQKTNLEPHLVCALGFISTCTEKKSVVFKLYLKPLLNQSQNKSSICPNQEKVTFDIVSLAIVLASCLWTSSLSQRYCYGGLIVTCHKSSFDQLIFTYCKRLTQLSNQFFTVVLLFFSSFSGSFSFTVCLLPSLPLPLSLFYNFCASSLLFYTFLFLLCLPVCEYITHSFSLNVCSYFFVFFQVRPLRLYVSVCPSLSLSLSVHLSVSISLYPMSVWYQFLFLPLSLSFCLTWSYEL